jgi:hypothetical protein
MSTQSPQDYDYSTKGTFAHGMAAFGGIVLATLGLFQFLEGLSAVFEDKVYVTSPDYVYSIDLTGWGWIHLVLGAIAVAVGIAILYGQTWALVAGIVIAVLSAVSNFAFLPYYPFWSMLVIALDVLVIWALTSLIRNT